MKCGKTDSEHMWQSRVRIRCEPKRDINIWFMHMYINVLVLLNCQCEMQQTVVHVYVDRHPLGLIINVWILIEFSVFPQQRLQPPQLRTCEASMQNLTQCLATTLMPTTWIPQVSFYWYNCHLNLVADIRKIDRWRSWCTSQPEQYLDFLCLIQRINKYSIPHQFSKIWYF